MSVIKILLGLLVYVLAGYGVYNIIIKINDKIKEYKVKQTDKEKDNK